MSIPKIIHYCWFGRGEIPATEKLCIESWSRVLPDFQLRFWNEDSFDIANACSYVKQAYHLKKYAFVSDYVRMYALYHHGGVYFDTDVEAIKPLDSFLGNDFFIGFENKTLLGTGIIGSQQSNWLLKEMLNHYDTKDFIDKNNNYDVTTNVQILSKILLRYGFNAVNSEQFINGIHIYERDFFNPKKINDVIFNVTDRTVTIHRFSGSWLTEREKRRGVNVIWRRFFRPSLRFLRDTLNNLLGEVKTKEMELQLKKLLR
ncbi:glycosyl transferase [Runella sp. CRIBMP]|uniref:glycosyltransferase family 32 protein n=1 Tax=Runella sp. CRIBMP TaxID=2683261 RepID=UPI0014131730|nr:glycosyltransferase [Runella sp. CRIBMP]NBB22840.1 glycosyl transferase [Runella sp. CRIBMP]